MLYLIVAGPLAHIEGFSPTIATPSSPPPRSPPPRSSQQFPPLTAEDKNKFLRLFIGNGPINGLLSGKLNILPSLTPSPCPNILTLSFQINR